jgi:hypothetical protein
MSLAYELVQTLISGLQLPNFIFNCVKFFAESPAFDCKICLVKNKIFAVSPQNQNLNKRLLSDALKNMRHPIALVISTDQYKRQAFRIGVNFDFDVF